MTNIEQRDDQGIEIVDIPTPLEIRKMTFWEMGPIEWLRMTIHNVLVRAKSPINFPMPDLHSKPIKKSSKKK